MVVDKQFQEDQRLAAIADSKRRWESISESTIQEEPDTTTGNMRIDINHWATQLVLRRLKMRDDDDTALFVCEHITTPRIVYLPTWVEAMLCEKCVFNFPPTPEDDQTCDECGAFPVLTYSCMFQLQEFIIVGAICGKCEQESRRKMGKPEGGSS